MLPDRRMASCISVLTGCLRMLFCIVLVFIWCIGAEASPLRIVDESADRLLVEFVMPTALLSATESGQHQELMLPGAVPRLQSSGLPALPFFAELVAAPPNATVSVEVLEAEFVEYEGVDYAVAQGQEPNDLDQQLPYEPGLLWPQARARLEQIGSIRGVPAHALRLYPVAYHAQGRTLRVYERMVLALRFEGGFRGKPFPATASVGPTAALYAPFLNPPRFQRSPIAVRKTTQGGVDGGWYDPAKKWVKILVVEESIHKIDRGWLERRFLEADGIDPRTFRLFLDGEEQPLYVEGGEDGSFDEADFCLFFGRKRRFRDAQGVERDHDSLYGKKNIYWFSWGGEPGKRFGSQSGAPINDYPASEWYWATSHFESDLWFDQLEFVVDNEGDHWFNPRIKADQPGKIGSTVVRGEISAPFLEEEYLTRLRVSLHGWSQLGHHTVLKFNEHIVDDTIWEGQVGLLVDEEIPSTYINEDEPTNRVTVQVFADQAPFDRVYFNWFELQYRRRYDTFPGHLAFPQTPSVGRRITLRKLSHPNVFLFDVASSVRITDALVEPSPDGLFVATFEDAPSHEPFYVAADSLSILVPRGFVDMASDWRSPANGADYVIITHDLFVNASNRLADHRRQSGLDVEVVNVTDVYDEFSGGQIQRNAIADFIQYTYDNWQPAPAYVLLMGDATYDYRNIIGGGRPSYVPSQYYQARNRGHSPSDYLYTLVDGDDLLPDLALGRLAVEGTEQADETVDRIIRYDTDPEGGDWRSRVIYLANYHAKGSFTEPSDALARTYTEPFGLESVKIYNPDNTPVPNVTGQAFLNALNRGALLVNFAGHGSANFMQFVIGLIPDWGYAGHINNGRKLPLVLALSCLNGMSVNPTVDSVGEVFTRLEDGGAIAYISSSAISFVAQNDLLSDHMYRQIFEDGLLAFGPTLNAAKVAVLTERSSFVEAALTMQLFGDPAQELALPVLADYTPVSLRAQSAPLMHGFNTQIELVVRNNARLTADSLAIALFGFSRGDAEPDTIAHLVYPSFVGSDTLNLDWAIEHSAGPYRLEVVVDPHGRVAEIDEFNNQLSVDVEILESTVATPIFPPAGGVVSSPDFTLEAVVPLADDAGGNTYSVEFLLGTQRPLTPESALAASMPVATDNGIAIYSPGVSPAVVDSAQSGADLIWRARVVDGATSGPWSDSQGFALLADGIGADAPDDERLWRQQGPQLLGGDAGNLILDEARQLQISAAALSFHPDGTQREDNFAVTGLEGAGIVCTDGTYLYAKRWFNDGSTVYPGVDEFARIGTGFNGTEAGRLYEFLSGPSTAGISATYHSDGFIYNENGNAFELERISTESGLLDTIAVTEGMLEWRSGLVEDGHFLIASDGRYIYNASMSSVSGVRTGWGVRVFDPADGWRIVREFTSEPTETGFTYMWTDGLLADGERLYLLEFDDSYRIRMIDAFDGRFLDEWVSEQETTHSVSGQYDWVNNKVWLGDLLGSDVYRYTGLSQLSSGTLTTDPIGPAHTWSSLDIEATATTGDLRIDLLSENESSGEWRPLEEYRDMEAQRIDLNAIDATRHPRLRLRASLRQRNTLAPTLSALQVRFRANPSLRIAAVEHADGDDGLRALVTIRNLSPFAVAGVRVVARTDDGVELVSTTVPVLLRGETHVVSLDSIPRPLTGRRLFAHLEIPIPDADPGDNVFEIELSQTVLPAFAFSLWPEGRPFVSGDPILAGQGLIIAATGVDEGEIELVVDGQPAEADSLLSGGRVLYRPSADRGDHLLRVSLHIGEKRYQSEIRLLVTDDLTLANPLVYPNPVTGPASFTYVLSHEAVVTVELFSLNGRLIRRLDPHRQPPGFSQTKWNGRDSGGSQLANGTYLYRIRARDDAGSAVEHRAPFLVAR